MGRDAKRAKQARRDQRRRADCGRPAVTLHAVSTPAEAMTALYGPGPASDDWRQDVLGGKPLSLRPGPDGTLRINGHPLTPDMCEALQAERPHDAADFEYDMLLAMGRDMTPGLEYCRPAP